MINRSPLHDLHVRNGARFGEYFGWEIVEEFGDPNLEYRAARDAVAVFDLSYLGKLRVSGRDRTRYLNSLLSNDIKNLKTGMGCYATLLTHQGRMESDLYVYAREEEFLLECPPAGRERLLQSLNKYIVSDVVSVEDASESLSVLSIQGPSSANLMERVLGIPLGEMGLLEFRSFSRPSASWLVVCRDRTGRGGYDLWLPPANVLEAWNLLVEAGRYRPAGHRTLNLLRTEAGIPWYGADMDDRTLPIEMGLTSAISLTKGCYRGQEIIARVTYRGHLDRKLGAVAIDHADAPAKGAKVMVSGALIGEVTSSIVSPALGRPLALAVLKSDFLSPGTKVEVAYENMSCPGEVVSLPLG